MCFQVCKEKDESPLNNQARMRTALKTQQALFLENLWKEMDKLSSSTRDASISKTASKYASDGYEPNEIVELLVSEGFDAYASKICVSKIGSAESDGEASEEDEPEWGFEAEDQCRGEVVSNFDVGCDEIKAANEEDAWEKIQTFLDTNCSDQYTITRVYQL